MSIHIAIFDHHKNAIDHTMMLLSKNSEMQVVGLFSTMHNCIIQVLHTRPDVILMDIGMPDTNWIENLKLLHKEFPQVQVLVHTSVEDDQSVINSLCAGASGYILKYQLNPCLIDSIRQMRIGGSPLSPPVALRVLNLMQQGFLKVLKPARQEYNLTSRGSTSIRAFQW